VDKEGVLHLTNMPTDHNVKYVMIMREKRILFKPNLDINKYDYLITRAANKFKLDSALIKAVIKAESNFNHRAVSPVGAQGLMQLMPKTASDLKVEDSFHPEKNIEGGARYLRYLLNTYKGDLTLALAAYNAGEKAVAKYNYNIPPYRETQNYVRRVLSFYNSYSKK
jgi:soluble lytic murein transglycosylase-like protein